MKALHFGAGNIGRGFIGQILHNNHFSITFVDANQEIVDQINRNKGYFIEYLNKEKNRFFIDNVDAINILLEREKVEYAVCEYDLITTSVGVNNLKKIAPIIKNGLLQRSGSGKAINIFANENAINASLLLKTEIKNISTESEWKKINDISFFVNTAIDRQSLSKVVNGESIALVEPYFEWVINKSELSPGTAYQLTSVKSVKELTPFIERKLFIVNAEHAAFAYVGALFDYETIQQSAADPRINALVRTFLQENSAYFIAEYAMDKKELDEFIDNTITRHSNPILSDPIERVGRDPIRKLDESDRLVSPVINLHKRGLDITTGIKIIAAAYSYYTLNDAESVQLQKLILEMGIKDSIKKISNLPEELTNRIAEIYQEIKNDKESLFK